MNYVSSKGHRLAGLILGLVATGVLMLAFSAPSASASSPFCGGQQINNANKCFGVQREMSGASGYGQSTGICIGADATQGQCSPTLAYAVVYVPAGNHAPWVIGTASNFTTANAESFN